MTTDNDNATINTSTSSIEVSQNAKNQFSFKVKMYFDKDVESENDIIDRLENIYKELSKKFA